MEMETTPSTPIRLFKSSKIGGRWVENYIIALNGLMQLKRIDGGETR